MSQTGAAPLAGRSVLILEDEPIVAEEMAEILEFLGMRVEGPYPSPQTAIAWLKDMSPDCGLLDINIHGRPSFEVAVMLAERQVPFAFMSAYSPDIVPAAFFTRPFLRKPIDLVELQITLEALLLYDRPPQGPARPSPEGAEAADLPARV